MSLITREVDWKVEAVVSQQVDASVTSTVTGSSKLLTPWPSKLRM